MKAENQIQKSKLHAFVENAEFFIRQKLGAVNRIFAFNEIFKINIEIKISSKVVFLQSSASISIKFYYDFITMLLMATVIIIFIVRVLLRRKKIGI